MRTVGYNFDVAGNRNGATGLSDKLSTEANAFTLNYTSNLNNQYSSVGVATLNYDARGNMTGYTEKGATTTHTVNCTYDAQNLLLSVTNNFDATNLTQAYDPLGRCVKRVENGVTSFFVYDLGWNLLVEYNADGTQRARYVGGAATDEILTKTDYGGNIVYYHTDGLGSITNLTDATGAVVESYTYDVYGNPSIKDASGNLSWTSAVGNRFLFTGREYIYALGVYDYRSRIYDPYLGRFWQPDSIGHSGDIYNLHRYCGNDPVNNTDPYGTDPFYSPSGYFSFTVYPNENQYFSNIANTAQGAAAFTNGYISLFPSAYIPSISNTPFFGLIYHSQIEAARVENTKTEFAKNSSFNGIASKNLTVSLYSSVAIGSSIEADGARLKNAAIWTSGAGLSFDLASPYLLNNLAALVNNHGLIGRMYFFDHGNAEAGQGFGHGFLVPNTLKQLSNYVSPSGDFIFMGCQAGTNKSYLKKMSTISGRAVGGWDGNTFYPRRNIPFGPKTRCNGGGWWNEGHFDYELPK